MYVCVRGIVFADKLFAEMFDLTKVLESLDAVLDVGGVYDPSRDRYDHHQKGFEEIFGHGFITKLSSAGLVYKVKLTTNTKSPFEVPIVVEAVNEGSRG